MSLVPKFGGASAALAGGLVAALAWTGFVRGAPAQAAPCPAKTIAAVSPQAPSDVCIPDGFTDVPMEYFDDYSWRVFLALVWPAAPGHRGEPAVGKKISDRGPLVFETYKALWEVFHRDGSAPGATFDSYDNAAHNACSV